MTEAAERLDRALDRRDRAPAADIRDLLGVAAEVADSLAGWRLTATDRARMYARTLELVRPTPLERERRLRAAWRVPALVGGGLVTLGALAAIGIAVVRGRRRGHAAQAA